MNYLFLFTLLTIFYFLASNNKISIILILGFGIYILYNDNILPKSYFTLPKKRKRLDFDFPKLKKLFKESEDLYQDFLNTKDSNDYQKYKLKLGEIQQSVNTIYFSFPYKQHHLLDRFFQENYDLNSK